jgi:hypothetical protein
MKCKLKFGIVNEGAMTITGHPKWLTTAKNRVKRAVYNGKGLCDRHLGELFAGRLVGARGVVLDFAGNEAP